MIFKGTWLRIEFETEVLPGMRAERLIIPRGVEHYPDLQGGSFGSYSSNPKATKHYW